MISNFCVGMINLIVMILCFKVFVEEHSRIKYIFLFFSILNFICMAWNFYWVIQ